VAVEWFQPEILSDLFGVFGLLEKGASVGLASANAKSGTTQPSLSPGVHPPSPLTESTAEEAPPPSALRLPASGAWLGVNSSGSTGVPKLVWRAWSDLRHEARDTDLVRGWTWASPFLPHTFAGVQVALQAWASHGQVLFVDAAWDQTWARLKAAHVDALSCTPTFLDLLLQNEPSDRPGWHPRQITLGGEVLRPAVGQRVARRFPATRVTVIYAAAEHGVLLKTHRLDGWYETDGFRRRGLEWRVQDGRLELKRGDNWLTTGDQVEVKGDLMRVVGRADAVANVAGTKVSLAEVAELAEQVPGVRRALAVAEPSPVTGQIVCLKYAVEPGAAPAAVLEALQAHLRQHLRKEAWPRRWELDEVGIGHNAKRGN
jgi:acyl-coenzyme A synthetase/AMP-(fatty) acid ligase